MGIGTRIGRAMVWLHGRVLHEAGGTFNEAKKVRRTGGKWLRLGKFLCGFLFFILACVTEGGINRRELGYIWSKRLLSCACTRLTTSDS